MTLNCAIKNLSNFNFDSKNITYFSQFYVKLIKIVLVVEVDVVVVVVVVVVNVGRLNDGQIE